MGIYKNKNVVGAKHCSLEEKTRIAEGKYKILDF
jgi:hypothetical protein